MTDTISTNPAAVAAAQPAPSVTDTSTNLFGEPDEGLTGPTHGLAAVGMLLYPNYFAQGAP
jgi:hypothetical protein